MIRRIPVCTCTSVPKTSTAGCRLQVTGCRFEYTYDSVTYTMFGWNKV